MLSEKSLSYLWELNKIQTSHKNTIISQRIKSKLRKLASTRKLIKEVVSKIGKFEPDDSVILSINTLEEESLSKLISNKCVCIHIPGFCPTPVAKDLCDFALLSYTHWKLRGEIETDMFYAGDSIPMEVAMHNKQQFFRYFSERDAFIENQRKLSNGSWPVDKLLLSLDSVWPHGAHLGSWFGEKQRPAIMRVMQEEKKINYSFSEYGMIHADSCIKLTPNFGKFSANIYLNTPEKGGELYIWDIRLRDINSLFKFIRSKLLMIITEELFDSEWQNLVREILPKPHVLKPNKGDLIIFNTGRLHSVGPVKEGVRVTSQLFINAYGETPLTIGA